ncbi:SAM-dependent methyltransferase [Leeia sp. TBRC 13508]|uniref:SAM-dependent methyltransferase n=1 Tax=Leeia speluncae TaxID=2884804 RepID=A0ABS8D6Q8_9NEIS|nr:SAM-dependent methyltransferase [Leeia speluncae]MCB6183861.1 SAM-dependent methyltransferase [Leeia speluncae]
MHVIGNKTELPAPSAEAQAVSDQLVAHLHQVIAENKGWIPFVKFEELALYAPGLGYYSNGSIKLGSQGDFTTAPELSCLFGQTIAKQIQQVLTQTGGDVLEFGPGSGKLALDILLALEKLNALPDHYYLLEVSGDLRERQQSRLKKEAPHLLHLVSWLDELPTTFTGVMLGNEVLDAIPTHLVRWTNDGIKEVGVSLIDGQFALVDRAIEDPSLLQQAESLPVEAPYLSEIQLRAAGFVSTLAQALTHGLLLMIDYGFSEREYYHPQRDQGTLMCHYRHHAHPDPLILVGLQDVTTHVDFTAMAVAGVNEGLTLSGYTSQAMFLANAGITDLLSEIDQTDLATYLPFANQVQRLMSPAEMGELFKVIALTRNIDDSLLGFSVGDRSHAL